MIFTAKSTTEASIDSVKFSLKIIKVFFCLFKN
jgi:hypothetical protein